VGKEQVQINRTTQKAQVVGSKEQVWVAGASLTSRMQPNCSLAVY